MHEHEQEHGSKGGDYCKRHLLIMVLCCLIPIVILITIAYANIESSYLSFLLLLLCPVLMILMHLISMLSRKTRK